MREYYQGNKTEIKEKQKEYKQANRTEIAEYQKEYRQANKTELIEKSKKYNQANKMKLAERQLKKFECECSCILTKGNLPKHRKTNKHLKLMNSK